MTEIMLVRSAPAPAEVRFGAREIDVLAIPYETSTDIDDQYGRYAETIARGAFGQIGSRAERIKVLREHNPVLAVGRCRRIDPNAADGLLSTLAIAATDLGDETLVLADEGVLDVSVRASSRGGDQWNMRRSQVRRTNLRLHEISLVAMAAYETAGVLAVRSAMLTPPPALPLATPYLDEVRAWMIENRYHPADQPERRDLPL